MARSGARHWQRLARHDEQVLELVWLASRLGAGDPGRALEHWLLQTGHGRLLAELTRIVEGGSPRAAERAQVRRSAAPTPASRISSALMQRTHCSGATSPTRAPPAGTLPPHSGSADGTGSRAADRTGPPRRPPARSAARAGAGRAPAPPTAAPRCRDAAGVANSAAVGRDLDDPADIHHRDAVADMLHHRQVVRDEQIGDAQPVLQFQHQVDDLRLHRNVQRGDRLVRHDQRRRQRERAGDADALALAAGEGVREAVQIGAPAGAPVPAVPPPARCGRARRSCRSPAAARR